MPDPGRGGRGHVGGDEPGRDRVGGDAELAQLLGQGLGEALQARLGRGVVDLARGCPARSWRRCSRSARTWPRPCASGPRGSSGSCRCRWTSITVSQSSSDILNSRLSRSRPALLTRTVGAPSSSATRLTAASTWSVLLTSAPTPRALPPASVISLTVPGRPARPGPARRRPCRRRPGGGRLPRRCLAPLRSRWQFAVSPATFASLSIRVVPALTLLVCWARLLGSSTGAIYWSVSDDRTCFCYCPLSVENVDVTGVVNHLVMPPGAGWPRRPGCWPARASNRCRCRRTRCTRCPG